MSNAMAGGRPRINPDALREATVSLVTTDDDKADWKDAAKKAGMSLNQWANQVLTAAAKKQLKKS